MSSKFKYHSNKWLLGCRDGKVIPWDLVKRGIEATHPYAVFIVRSMLAVPFFEKAVYELPEEQVTPEQVTALADSIEKDVEGGLAGRSDTAQSESRFHRSPVTLFSVTVHTTHQSQRM